MSFQKQLEKLATLEDVSIDLDAVHEPSGEKVKDIYCAHLPYAIKGHELALATIKNPFAKLIIMLAIQILKAIGNRFCEEKI